MTTSIVTGDQTGGKIEITYRVAGDPALNLGYIAPATDAVLMEQFGRLVRFTDARPLD